MSARPFRQYFSRVSQRCFTTRPSWQNLSSAHPVSPSQYFERDVLVSHWNTYLATGRGSAALFGFIDRDNDGVLKKRDIRYFLEEAVKGDEVHEEALKQLDKLADEQPLTFQEFQDWLVDATHENTRDIVNIQPLYEACPFVGNRTSPEEKKHRWTKSSMSQNVRRMQYAVRGEVVIKADQMAAEGKKIIYTNVGNPHSVGQPPITYYRQVLALCDLPPELGVDHPSALQMFPSDALDRARELKSIIGPSGTGAYTHSQGMRGFREHVAHYIQQRDGQEAFPGNIFLTNGASSAIEMILTSLISGDKDAVMIPIPQYPIYSALITRLGGRQVGYELDESLGWAVTEEELEHRLLRAREKGLDVKGFVLINPGNPTGQVLQRDDLEMICLFCAKHGIVLLADEVYQRNVYADGLSFLSAKKIAMETPGCEQLELVSFHSTSKGFIGECGRRGGYMELHGIDAYVQSQLYKLASSGLCSNVDGQVMTSLMVSGPDPSGESYAGFVREENAIFESLKRKAKTLVDGLNRVDGISCQPAEGAMYAFPSIELPQKALEAAESMGKSPDAIYALSLLDSTGICVVPASGFGQKKGRVGFRTTFLPPEDELVAAVDMIAQHHIEFVTMYK